MNPNVKSRRGRRIFLSVLLVLLLLLGSAAFLLREEIALLYYAMTTSPDAVQSQKAENDKRTQELLDELAAQTMRDLTDEEREMLANGALSPEEALALIRGETLPVSAETVAPIETTSIPETTCPAETTEASSVTEIVSSAMNPIETTVAVTTAAPKPVETTAATVTTAPTTTAVVTVATTTAPAIDRTALQNRQNEIIAEIYLLRATYLNEIDALIEDMKWEFASLPLEEQNLLAKMAIAEKALPKGTALEDVCDAKMEALLVELESILKQLGSSTAIIDEIKDTYAEQKVLKKTELYNEYLPKMK